MAMLRHLVDEGGGVPATLLLSSRSWDDVIYRDELERLAAGDVRVVHTLTRAQPEGWDGYARRVDAEMLAEVGPRQPSGRRSTSAARRRSWRRSRTRSWSSATSLASYEPNASARQEDEMEHWTETRPPGFCGRSSRPR